MKNFNQILNYPLKLTSHIKFLNFQKKIHKKTVNDHISIVEFAKLQAKRLDVDDYRNSLINRGCLLRDSILSTFKNKYKYNQDLRILIHVPPPNVSPAGYSIFTNLVDTLTFMGVACKQLDWNVPIGEYLYSFRPSVLLTSDNIQYINQLDFNVIDKYKSIHPFRVGLTASIEAYGNTSLNDRLKWAVKNKVNFYYSFRTREYIQNRSEYKPFFEEGFKIYQIEFGANPLLYFPTINTNNFIPFVFLGSSNSHKHHRYIEWLGDIVEKHHGFINGPGWIKMNTSIPMNLNRYIYARARVGINLHLDEQVRWANELNERTYTLAACGIPQLIDNPKLLSSRFSAGSMFQANSAREYLDLFHHILDSPDEANFKATLALEEVYSKHTTFHRAEMFIKQLTNI